MDPYLLLNDWTPVVEGVEGEDQGSRCESWGGMGDGAIRWPPGLCHGAGAHQWRALEVAWKRTRPSRKMVA